MTEPSNDQRRMYGDLAWTWPILSRKEHYVGEAESFRDVFREYARISLGDDIQKALLELPIEFREAVVLCDVVGLSYEEIANATAVPIGTVRSRIHRGRKIMKELLS